MADDITRFVQPGGHRNSSEKSTDSCEGSDRDDAIFDDYICEACRSIDFGNILAELREEATVAGSTQCEVVVESDKEFDPNCKLCMILDQDGENEHDKLIATFPPESHFDDHEDDGKLCRALAASKAMWLLGVSSGEGGVPQYLNQISSFTWTACYRTSDAPKIFQPRPMSTVIDIRMMRSWLKTCQQHHQTSCLPTRPPENLLLIDCKDLEVRTVIKDAQYAALSYVWHKNAKESSTSSSPGRCSRPSLENASEVVLDAIQMTLKLGLRFLWVDKYCINQSNEDVKLKQINNMGLIYRSAQVTIIATAGEDELTGLPGVETCRPAQVSFEIGDFTILGVPPTTYHVNTQTNWATRAWTVQEELFSPRRFYVTDDQVFFACSSMQCFESLHGVDLAKDPIDVVEYSELSFNFERFDGMKTASRALLSKEGTVVKISADSSMSFQLRALMDVLSIYTRRKMTFDSDSIRACAGILERFTQTSIPIYSMQGLPIPWPIKPATGFLEKSIATALSWTHEQPSLACRRADYPSWTWAGWAGGMAYRDGLERIDDLQGCPLAMSIENANGDQLEVTRIISPLAFTGQALAPQLPHAPAQHGPVDHRQLGSVPVAVIFNAIEIPAETITFTDHDSLQGWRTGGRFLTLQLTGPYGGSMELPFTPEFFLDGLRTGSLSCFLLGYAGFNGEIEEAHLLIVQWRGTINAQRIGKLDAKNWNRTGTSFSSQLEHLGRRKVRLL